jgi:hypothetical protein
MYYVYTRNVSRIAPLDQVRRVSGARLLIVARLGQLQPGQRRQPEIC